MEILEKERFSAQLIRDMCSCADCRHPNNGQRLRSVLDLPDNLEILTISLPEPDFVVFELTDGHKVKLSLSQVEQMMHHTQFFDPRSESAKILWSGIHIRVEKIDWNEYLSDTTVRLNSLNNIAKLGFVILSGVPRNSGSVLEVIDTFGYVRETNYGDLFDVKVEERPQNLAFTSLAIAPHTDNPYRDPVPTLQLLHCLQTNVQGGNSGLVDSFQVANNLRKFHPEAFEILATENFHFVYESEFAFLECISPILKLNSHGEVVGVRWNDRSMQSPAMTENIEEVFSALKLFAQIANSPEMALEFRLDPGDCVIFDNTRLLHSRTAFESSGTRHLQGAYADLDSLMSSKHILERSLVESL